MKMRSALAAITGVTALALIPAATAAAQPAGANPAAPVRASQRISLTRLHLISGVVRSQNGQALAGVCVLATGPKGVVRMVRTSAGGRYEMSVPQAGAYSVQYRDCVPGHASVAVSPSREAQIGAGPITSLPAAIVGLPGQATAKQVLASAGVLTPKPGRIIMARPGEVIENGRARRETAESSSLAVITGRVTNPSGHPLAGICMWIVGKYFAAGTETNKHGAYRFATAGGGIPGHRYPVEFDSDCDTANPFVPIAPGRWAPEWYKAKFSSSKATKVLLRAGKTVRNISAVMERGGEVSGTISGSDHRRLKNACAVLTNSSGQEFGQALTNRTGEYTITGLDPGRYRLAGIASCTGGTSDYGQAWYPHAPGIKKAEVISVRLGHKVTGIDVVLPKLGTITGFVRAGGRTGKPLGGMCIGVYSPTNVDLGGFATSQRTGKYVVPGLPAGDYQVEANVGGCGNNGNYVTAYYPRPVHVADAKTTAGINLYMQPGGVVTGTVTAAATAQPLGGVCVGDENGDFSVTGKNGTYTIDQLPTGRLTVSFSGGCGNAGSFAPQYYNGQVTQEAAQQVSVKAGHVTSGVDAAMQPGARISGTVTYSSGHPVRGICVAAVAGAPGAAYTPFYGDTVTAANGSYTESNLAPGAYALAFFAGCQGPSNAAALQWFKGTAESGRAGLVSAAAGQPVTGVDVRVERGGSVSGTIIGAGHPIEFSCMTAISRATGEPAGFQALSGSGQYVISGLPAGSYTVTGYDCGEVNGLANGTYPRQVTVRSGHTVSHVNVVLPPGGVIAGRVTVAATKRPAGNVCVEAVWASGGPFALLNGGGAITSGTGSYRITSLNSGRYRIQVYADCSGGRPELGNLTLGRTVKVTQGKVTSGIDASLHGGGSITGRVTGQGTQAEPGVCVEVFQIRGGLADVEQTDSHGLYTSAGLAPGRYKVEFNDNCGDGGLGLGIQWYRGAGWSGAATVISVAAGKTTAGINASLPADGAIAGSVTGTGASPLTGVCVSAVPLAGAQPTIYAVSSVGAYTLGDLLPGKYRVEFQAGCGKSGVKTQWWQGAGSSGGAKIITVSPGGTISGIDAVMATT